MYSSQVGFHLASLHRAEGQPSATSKIEYCDFSQLLALAVRAPHISAANQHKHSEGPHEVNFTPPHALTVGLRSFGCMYFKFQWHVPLHSPMMQLCPWNCFCVCLFSLAAFNTFFKFRFLPFPLCPCQFFKQSAVSLLQKWPKRLSTLSLHGWLLLFHPVEAEMIGPLFPILLPPRAFLMESRRRW